MKLIDTIYIDGAFVKPHGSERFDLVNPSTEAVIGQVTLGDEIDTQNAVDAAVRAFPAFSRTSRSERIAMLHRLHDALMARSDDLNAATIEEYGAPQARAQWSTRYAAEAFLSMATTLETYEFTRRVSTAEVVMEPVGVVGLITPWNANAGFICNKLATAIAAGCTTVIKPSEMSALQTQIVIEALHEAGLPPGVFNVVNGLGSVVGATLAAHPKIAKISFTGSTAVGKSILRTGAETMKRVTLELGGKSPTLLLDDANFAEALPLALSLAFMNSGQACIAGTRLLVPEQRLDEVIERVRTLIAAIQSGDPYDPATTIGPMVNRKQYERVQHYIRVGEEEGATLIAGGAGRPDGLTRGYFVKPTVFAHVTNDMTIAREEIFGPVLSILAYRSEEEAIEIANDTVYGLQASVFSSNPARARSVASRLDAGRVLINGVHHDPLAPFGGHKQSGIGREYGAFGLEAYLEPKTLLGSAG
ncbi:aldehyde dehydrogenase family protein [Paraburkholderia megapolitana]|uniref:aldehyde dehydrogenase (NAD(+)) n=1 Tax=Paraburkholderia megapolitana TaxID=420953 RepID=A0A1I3GCQ6_9BURK|nr:aldehyde dehydrogenase family protein [Paraburkholderia megapolitana]QDQ82834.1 aldehyde dehydrogenase family protein [Paraburkholderia megapolitana]SFI20971.1 aldehyde dehydrogenase (NAD+) [Paraburkholderia megapolitana]